MHADWMLSHHGFWRLVWGGGLSCAALRRGAGQEKMTAPEQCSWRKGHHGQRAECSVRVRLAIMRLHRLTIDR